MNPRIPRRQPVSHFPVLYFLSEGLLVGSATGVGSGLVGVVSGGGPAFLNDTSTRLKEEILPYAS